MMPPRLLPLLFGMICSCESGYTAKTEEKTPQTATTIAASVPAPKAPERVNITFSSEPPGVEIWLDGVFIGVSPKVVSLPKSSKESTLEFKKVGYVSATQKITLDVNRPIIVKLRASTKKR